MRQYIVVHIKCECCHDRRSAHVHHRWPQQHWRSYEGDIHGDDNLCAVCSICHAWYDDEVGASPNPHGRNAGKNFARLKHRRPGPRWESMAPEYVLEDYRRYIRQERERASQ